MGRLRPDDLTPVGALRNLGPASVRLLAHVDVRTAGDLRRLGPDLVFRLLRETRADVSLNLLYAMSAGLEDRHWLDLSEDERRSLRARVND